MKLTKTQRAALEAMPFSVTTWGSTVLVKPKGVGTQATWWALRRKGLADVKRDCARDVWKQTAAGRAALAAQGK